MTFTRVQLIERALREIGVLGIGRSMNNGHSLIATPYVDEMIEAYKIRRNAIYQVVNQPFTLTASRQDYNIGPGLSSPHFAYTPKPIFLASAQVFMVGDTIAQPLDIWTLSRWLAERNKAMTDLAPRAVVMDEGNTYNTLHFWPMPTTAATVYLGLPTAVTGLADDTTSYTFPEGYHKAFRLELSMALAPAFGKKDELPRLDKQWRDAFGELARINDQGPPTLAPNGNLSGRGYYDVYSDSDYPPRRTS